MGTKQKPTVLTKPQFYMLCEKMKERREELERLRGVQVLIAKLEEMLGFAVTRGAIEEAADILKVNLVMSSRTTTGKPNRKSRVENHVRAHNNALIKLYENLGVEVPESLYKIRDYYRNSGPGLEDEAQQFKVPIHEQPTPQVAPLPVPNLSTKNLSVANRVNDNNRR